jgi:hypothetical protein
VTTPTTTDTNTNKINPSSATDLTSPGPVVGVRNDGQHTHPADTRPEHSIPWKSWTDQRLQRASAPPDMIAQKSRPPPQLFRGLRLKCIYMAIMSLDPTGAGQRRWSIRWKPALNAFDMAFDGRLSAGRK